MAVKRINTGKFISVVNPEHPNFKKEEHLKEVNGNRIQPEFENNEDNIYGERKHTYTPDPNGNLQMEQLMGKLMNKLDNIPENSQTRTNAIDVDIKREIAIGKVDTSAVKSEESGV